MSLEKLIAVTGMSGIQKLIANRTNGLIVEELVTGKRKFVPSRGHQFTPLESIGVFTDDGETIELKKVFEAMLNLQASNPPIDPESPSKDLQEYFAQVLPNFDRDKVKISDIKKMIKWFGILLAQGILSPEKENKDSRGEEE